MATTSHRTINISYSGDLIGVEFPFGAVNPASSINSSLQFFTSGDNTLDVPIEAVGLTLVPPVSNTVLFILKGDAADVGVTLHLTHPSSIAIDPLSPIIVNVDADVEGVRVIYT